jgi:hypothetical protein
MPTWVQDPDTGKLIPKQEWLRMKYEGASQPPTAILNDIEAFVSPIDGSVLTGRAALREHNKRHGVTNIRDYGENYFDRKNMERSANLLGSTREARLDRIESLKRVISEVEK